MSRALNLMREQRLQAIWVAVGTEGEWKGKILGQVPVKTLIKQLHEFVERLEKGVETRWPPTPTYNGLPCEFVIMRPPQDRGLVIP